MGVLYRKASNIQLHAPSDNAASKSKEKQEVFLRFGSLHFSREKLREAACLQMWTRLSLERQVQNDVKLVKSFGAGCGIHLPIPDRW